MRKKRILLHIIITVALCAVLFAEALLPYSLSESISYFTLPVLCAVLGSLMCGVISGLVTAIVPTVVIRIIIDGEPFYPDCAVILVSLFVLTVCVCLCYYRFHSAFGAVVLGITGWEITNALSKFLFAYFSGKTYGIRALFYDGIIKTWPGFIATVILSVIVINVLRKKRVMYILRGETDE